MEKKTGTIVVVECISSSINYIKDIIDEGYEPILLELGCPEELYTVYRISHDLSLKEMFTNEYPDLPAPRIVEAGKAYKDTLELVRKLNPVLIVPGGDDGIEMSMKLSCDLGLVTNAPELFGKMRNKYLAQQALRSAGIRCINSKIVYSRKEADEFFAELGGQQAVLKPISGGASVGVHICLSCEEYSKWIDTYSADELSNFGILMQKRIDGMEYIFNTVSCRGHHKVTSIMSCGKVPIEGHSNRYNTQTILESSSATAKLLMDYGLKVLDSIGIQYGPVHSEIMIDEAGPVLIEANCRLCGATMRARWMDKVFGNHESNISLQAYLHPEAFLADKRTVLMDGKEYGVMKFLAIDHNMYVKKSLIKTALKDIPGVMYITSMGDGRIYFRTVDLSTASGIVFLADKDLAVISRSLEMIDDIQKNHLEILYEIR